MHILGRPYPTRAQAPEPQAAAAGRALLVSVLRDLHAALLQEALRDRLSPRPPAPAPRRTGISLLSPDSALAPAPGAPARPHAPLLGQAGQGCGPWPCHRSLSLTPGQLIPLYFERKKFHSEVWFKKSPRPVRQIPQRKPGLCCGPEAGRGRGPGAEAPPRGSRPGGRPGSQPRLPLPRLPLPVTTLTAFDRFPT